MDNMGRWLLKSVVAVVLVTTLTALVCGVLVFSGTPAVPAQAALTPELVSRAQQLLRDHNPRRTRTGQPRVAEISANDVSVLVAYAASRFGISATVDIGDGAAIFRASVPVRSPFGSYVNISATMPDSEGLPHLTRVRAGALPVPDAVANRVVRSAVRRWSQADSEQLAADTIRSVSMRDGTLRLEYQWRTDSADRMRAIAVPAADAERLRAYHERLVGVVGTLPPERRSIVDILSPLLELARVRSAAGGDAAVENRAALVAAAFYANEVDMAAVVADAERWSRPRRRVLRLRSRGDLARHFLVSAVLTATAGTPLSNVVGLSKELEDSRGGSGFSFSDIAADRAGTAFGALAVAPGDTFRTRTEAGLTEGDLMPEVADLVDNLPELEFRQRFGGVNSPEYNRVLADIDRRIAACRLYRPN